ncbi:MAG: UDP-N-acetylmuramate dehydrogenase [Firmicutes bacterium]|nr:UDP-N-acetylmuramate dehydrogenase [Bacillota bacterium]
MKQILKSYLEHICGAEHVFEDFPLAGQTTFKIGGKAKFFVAVQSKEILFKLISALKYIEEKYFVIGNGSNLLVSDKGYDGVVIKLGFAEIIENGQFVYADAGVILSRVTAFARSHELGGLEWTVGIPATVGGATYMNAGAHGHQISDSIVCVDVLIDDEFKTIESTQLKFDYRKSIFQKNKNWIILGAYFYFKKEKKQTIERKESEYKKKRINHPIEPSAGSTFKKPHEEFYVGKVIDELGLKGKEIGGAQISKKHAGFIVNKGGATCHDVEKLISLVRKEVYKIHGVKLKLEYEKLK